MRLLIPFDIVPVETQVPQSAFGVAPASERAVRYALEIFGDHDDLEIIAVQLTADTIDLEENMGVAEMRKIADELGANAEISMHSVQDLESMADLRQEILDIVAQEDIETVVMGYEEDSFADAMFTGSTPEQILEERKTPVVLVP
ncbi:universal stress protein [Halobellus ordinarius]|uniref:universal stress protein n=1 Tax=Halobellus ordinarius TaxID=3075120 RepID=UPI002880982E|nr:universal stress protein [Halobellus sp. ZY16]